jgi:cytochrome c553
MILPVSEQEKSVGTGRRSHIFMIVATMTALLVAMTSGSAQGEDIAEKAKLCATCHGEDGKPKEADTPIIWGQHTGYLYIELRDYKSGFRKNDKMSVIAADLSKEDMMALAQYFSEKPWPLLDTSATDADAAAGERIASAGICKECHLDGYVGTGTVPRISGQSPTYLETTLLDFKTRKRANNPDKSTLLASFSDDELKTMARYLAGIHHQ